MGRNHKKLRNDKWMNLIASDWFSMFLEYLNLFAIIQIDNSFCNHKDRPTWLNLLRNIRPIVQVNDMNIQGITHWLILKDVHPSGMIIHVLNNDKITPDIILRLSQISSKLKSIKCYVNELFISIWSALFQFLGGHNPLLEEIYVSCSSSCTSSLSESDVKQFKESMKHFFVGCPLLRSLKLTLGRFLPEANEVCIQICNTLFQCLGDYNPLLENLDVNSYSESMPLLSESDVEQLMESLKHFLVRCTLLRCLELEVSELPSQCITTIANYASNVETLAINGRLLEKGPIITKETNKLKKLSFLYLSRIDTLYDENFKNLVTGCDQLEFIFVGDCSVLTDIGIYSIAENCPNLKQIRLPYFRRAGEGDITVEVLHTLVNKCSKLTKIHSCDVLPKVIKQKLKKRVKALKLQNNNLYKCSS